MVPCKAEELSTWEAHESLRNLMEHCRTVRKLLKEAFDRRKQLIGDNRTVPELGPAAKISLWQRTFHPWQTTFKLISNTYQAICALQLHQTTTPQSYAINRNMDLDIPPIPYILI